MVSLKRKAIDNNLIKNNLNEIFQSRHNFEYLVNISVKYDSVFKIKFRFYSCYSIKWHFSHNSSQLD